MKIGIIVSTYSKANPYLYDFLKSILNQSYRDFEFFLAVNEGGSISNTYNDLAKQAKEKNCTHILIVGSDDILDVDCISELYKYPESKVVTFLVELFGSDLPVWLPSYESDPVKAKTHVPYYAFAMFDVDLFLKYKYRDVIGEDWDLWQRLLDDGVEVEVIQKVLYYYRRHEKQVSRGGGK